MTLIDRLGPKRIITLASLAAVAGILLLANLYVITPKKASSKQQLVVVEAEKTKLQGEVAQMRASYDVFIKQKRFFEDVSRMGFFNDQDRVLVRERFNTIQRLSKVISARYEVKPAAILDQPDPNVSPDMPVSDYVVMESPITLELSALDDVDIYKFLYYLNYGFSGYITIKNLSVERKLNPDVPNLKTIGRGLPLEMVTAKMDLSWTTMAKRSAVAQNISADPNSPAGTGHP